MLHFSFLKRVSHPCVITRKIDYLLFDELILQSMINHLLWNQIVTFCILLNNWYVINYIFDDIILLNNLLSRHHDNFRLILNVFLVVWDMCHWLECLDLLVIKLLLKFTCFSLQLGLLFPQMKFFLS